jgi:ribose 5-phosphate isomerase B
MKIALGSDHAGFNYKNNLIEELEEEGFEAKDFGPIESDSVDYPDFAHPVAKAVEAGEYDLGILLCGSGNGVAMTANKHEGIRAALCWTEELAELARKHNNANILCIPARFIEYELASDIAEIFVNTEFEGGRHQRRVEKISC